MISTTVLSDEYITGMGLILTRVVKTIGLEKPPLAADGYMEYVTAACTFRSLLGGGVQGEKKYYGDLDGGHVHQK